MAVVSDSFDRTNSSNLGSDWSEDSGSWEINSNAVRQTSATGVYRKLRWVGSALAGANNYVESPVTFGTLTAVGAGVAVRMATSSTVTFYALIGFPGDQFYIIEITAGAEAILDSGGTCNTSTTYTMRVEVDGSNIRGLVNGVEVVSASDASLSTGGVGLITYGGDSTLAPTFASFGAGDLAGTQYTQSVSGAVSPAGALGKQGRKVLAGSAGPAGLLVKQVRRAWAGAITPAGSLATIRTVLIALAGAFAPVGALLKRTGKGLAGATAPAGVLARQINKSLAARLFLNAGYCLRFYGNGTGQIDRVRIALDPGGSSTPVDIGAGDFTIECWINCLYANNTSTSIGDARYSNIFLDRDIYGHERGFVAGVTRRSGPILAVCFGVAGAGLTWTTIYGTTQVGDGNWHHVAIVRRQSTGAVQLYVDGVLDASGTYTTGDLSYPDGYDPGIGQDNPYIVLGTEKHDVGVGYNGLMDELRISDSRRYTAAFTPPGTAFGPDANTVGLYHCNDVAGTVLRDSATVAGAPTDGELLVGGSPSGPEWVVSTAFNPLSIVRILLLTLTGAISPSGAMVRQARKVLAGAATPVGDLSRQIRKVQAGTVTPAGTLSSIKIALLVLAGAITPAGNLIKQSVRSLAGAATPAGSLTKQTRRGLSGSMTPAGSLALIKTILLALAGAISPAGILARRTAKTLTGAMAPVGEVTKLVQRILTGAITPDGAVSNLRIILLLVDSVVTPVGALARETRKALAGAVTPAGSLVKRIARALGGIIGPSGSLAAVLSESVEVVRELTLRDRTLSLTVLDRTLTLTMRNRSLSLTLLDR